MRTALDMAQRLKQQSLRQIATEVALLNHTPIPQPLSLLAIMKLFANVAKPEIPANLANEFKFPIESPTLSPIFSDISWTDPGAKTFRYATRYRCKLSVGYSGGYADIGGDADLWTTDTDAVFEVPLNFDTDYKASVYAWNEWGASEWRWLKLHTYDNPNPPSHGPGQSPPPPKPQEPSGLQFWNCDASVNPSSVYFWLLDLTAGTPGKYWQVAPGYNKGSCGPGLTDAQLTIPSASTGSLVTGNEYQWKVVVPDRPGCGGNNDPDNPYCIAASDTFTAGNDASLPIPWSNT